MTESTGTYKRIIADSIFNDDINVLCWNGATTPVAAVFPGSTYGACPGAGKF